MRRVWIVAGLVVAVAAGAVGYQLAKNWKQYHYAGTRLKADLGRPDALIRTASLSQLPRDFLKVPIARDVLTEDLVYYYEQGEDRLGLNGALKRIAYEHDLDWTDRLLVSIFNEPAELALWRDGKGALRNYALVVRRNALAKVLQEAASVALKDSQLSAAGEIETPAGTAKVYALTLNPRRTLLLISQGDRLVVLSDPGLLFDNGNKVVAEAQEAVAQWLTSDGTLSRQFALDDGAPPAAGTGKPTHTVAIGAPALSLGYGAFMPGFRGLRFDFGSTWSTSVWVEPAALPKTGLGDAALWKAVPANPSACVVLPLDWNAAQKVVTEARNKPNLGEGANLAALSGSALACWYGESTLYSPVFVVKIAAGLGDRKASLQALANWAIAQRDAKGGKTGPATIAEKGGVMQWRSATPVAADVLAQHPKVLPAALAARGDYVAFSPDGALVDLVLATLARANPSVADQMPAGDGTLALITPRRLSPMAEQEALAALSDGDDTSLRDVAQAKLPSHMKALAAYPPYRLELPAPGKPLFGNAASGWQRVEWRTKEDAK
jgi:uncharacterized protein YfaA (DUF2138 family)